jgi:hypothetical protein
VPPPEVVEQALGVGHPFLDEDDGILPHAAGDDQVRARHDQVVGTVAPLLIDGEMVTLEVSEGPSRELVAHGRRFGEPQLLQCFRVPVVEVGTEKAVALDHLLRDLMHLRGLVDRAANEQDAWSTGSVHVPVTLPSHTM